MHAVMKAWRVYLRGGTQFMSDVTRILSRIESGDPVAAEQLLPLVYDELRRLAAAKLAREKPGQTLQPTALVHEAFLRLVDVENVQFWDSRHHFFSAAAEAMRRILVDNARRRKSAKRGGQWRRVDLDEAELEACLPCEDLVALHEALSRLEQKDRKKADLVKLRFFAGLTNVQAAEVLGVSTTTADSYWAYARCWLRLEMMETGQN
jgi:RNA polymerase sigma factor (TIGR02999 family)